MFNRNFNRIFNRNFNKRILVFYREWKYPLNVTFNSISLTILFNYLVYNISNKKLKKK